MPQTLSRPPQQSSGPGRASWRASPKPGGGVGPRGQQDYVTRRQMEAMLGEHFDKIAKMLEAAAGRGRQQRAAAQAPRRATKQGRPLLDVGGRTAVPDRFDQTAELMGDEGEGDDVSLIEPMRSPLGGADNICGREGTVKIATAEMPEITKFMFKPSVSTQSYASNKTDGFKRKVCGSREASGSLEGKWDRLDPIINHFTEGDFTTLLLHWDETRLVSVPSLITGMNFEVDMDEDTIDGWTADFEADGEWTYTFAASTTTTPAP